jgi:hypothetical protein
MTVWQWQQPTSPLLMVIMIPVSGLFVNDDIGSGVVKPITYLMKS